MKIINRRSALTNADEFFKKSASICVYLRLILFCAFLAINPAFGQISPEIELYAELIRRGNTEQKRTALLRLRGLESAEASLAAVPALRDSAEIVRAPATHSVIFLPQDEALRVLLPLLNDRSEYVRREAAYALGEVGNPAAAQPLIKLMLGDKQLSVRDAAAVALGTTGDINSAEFLTQYLKRRVKDTDDFLRRASARSIGQIAQRLNQAIKANPELFFPKETNLENRRLLAIEVFPALSNVSAVLIQTLQNPEEINDVKREAAWALGEIRDKRAFSVLQQFLFDEDYYLAQIAAEAVRKIQTEQKK
ncbi:MAG TPA: HEAT repeat domain-containing protein [Pyrinomonadaceae bacterium]|nr:HEAT repeat domain-containing protein [Pyrinomonadaceae bacterium]